MQNLGFEANAINLIDNILKNDKKLYVIYNYYNETKLLNSILIDSKYQFFKCTKESLFKNDLATKILSKKVLVFTSFRFNNKESIINKLKEISKSIPNKIILCINANLDNERLQLNKDYNAFFPINLNYVSSYNNHILTANFIEYQFKIMQSQLNKNGSITWLNTNITYEKTNGKRTNNIINKVRSHIFNIGDDVYIYYTHLPLNKAAILLKFTVVNNGYYNDKYESDPCFYEDKDNFYAIKLALKSGLNQNIPYTYFDYNHLFLDEKSVNSKGQKINKLRGKINIIKEDVVKELDKSLNSKIKSDEIIERLEKTFGSKCALEDCELLNQNHYNHQTFYRSNGLKYYELHHLIEKNNKSLAKLIDKDYNLIPLCSNCHNRIHYGDKRDRKLMVTALYEKNKSKYLKDFKEEYNDKYKGEELTKILEQYL